MPNFLQYYFPSILAEKNLNAQLRAEGRIAANPYCKPQQLAVLQSDCRQHFNPAQSVMHVSQLKLMNEACGSDLTCSTAHNYQAQSCIFS